MKCVLCGKEIVGYGNNAMPIKNGQCCNDCNLTKVIPARINLIKKGEKNNDKVQ